MKIKISELKKIVRRNISEGPLIGHNDVSNRHPLKHILEKWNLEIVPTGRSAMGQLGKGSFGEVFEVAQGKKHYALKVTRSRSDYNAYAQIKSFRDSLPAIAKGALPRVIKQEIDDEDSEYPTCYTLMEYLVPLSENQKVSMFKMYASYHTPNYGITPKMLSKWVIGFDDVIKKTVTSEIGADAFMDFMNEKDNMLKWSNFIDMLNQGKLWPPLHSMGSTPPEKFQSFEVELRRVLSQLLGPTFYSVTQDLIHMYDDLLSDKLDFADFPVHDAHSNKIPDIKDKRAKRLVVALNWLSKKGYTDGWNDVHYENVMIRPSTGEFVVADVGLFHFG